MTLENIQHGLNLLIEQSSLVVDPGEMPMAILIMLQIAKMLLLVLLLLPASRVDF